MSFIAAGFLIVFLFKWQEDAQEQYYQSLSKSRKNNIDKNWLKKLTKDTNKTALYLHFTNERCPYNDLGYESFISLYEQFAKEVSFAIVYDKSQTHEQIENIIKTHGLEQVKAICDEEGKIRKALSIHSLPRAVIISNKSELFYEGNYNHSSILCGFGSIDYGRVALSALLKGEELPQIGYFVLKETDCI